MSDADRNAATFAAYTNALETRDRAALLALFTDDVVQVDPYPEPARTGRDEVGAFFDATWEMAEALEFVPGRAILAGDRGVFPFTVRSTIAGGTVVEVDAVDVMTFTDDGRIAAITAYVDMAGMRSV